MWKELYELAKDSGYVGQFLTAAFLVRGYLGKKNVIRSKIKLQPRLIYLGMFWLLGIVRDRNWKNCSVQTSIY